MAQPLRDDLMVQQQIDGAWQHMVGVIMLNQTGRKQVKQVLQNLLEKWPTPEQLLKAGIDEIEAVLKPLGMWKRRADTIRRMSFDFMTWDGEDANGKIAWLEGRFAEMGIRLFNDGSGSQRCY